MEFGKIMTPVLQYKKLLYSLHELIFHNKDEEDNGNIIRDDMDIPWREMSKEERDEMTEFSRELYSLSDGCKCIPMNKEMAELLLKSLSVAEYEGAIGQLEVKRVKRILECFVENT